jgi:uncharacterized membrane protein
MSQKRQFIEHIILKIYACLIIAIYSQTGFYYYHCVYPSAGGLLIPEDIINPVISVLTLILFIKYIYRWSSNMYKYFMMHHSQYVTR